MHTQEQHILRILGEATEPLFPSDIAERLNAELVAGPAFDATEVIKRLQSLYDQVIQSQDGRWTLKRRIV